jgi:dihydrolipoamide dehydrogenase
MLSCDVAIIGAGTAGMAALRKLKDTGLQVLMIDPEFRGTTCANTGCMPSKLIIAAAEAAHMARSATVFGVEAEPRIDGAAVMARVRKLRDEFASGTQNTLMDMTDGIRLQSRARFIGPNQLQLDDGRQVTAQRIIIATGSDPMLPGPYQALSDLCLTNETVFEIPDLPRSLAVIGAGPIGVELAQSFARLGVDVALFDTGSTVAGLSDRAVSDALADALRLEFPVHLDVTPEPRRAGDQVELSWGTDPSKRFDRVLVATGRPPNLDGLDLETTGLQLDDHGTPVFDPETLQCGDAPIFLAGDANAARPLLHEASSEGAIAGANAASWPDLGDATRMEPLAITFTRPNAATIGQVPQPGCATTVTGSADYTDQGRAKVEARAHGLLRIYADRHKGRILGASLAAPDGEHLAHLLAWAISAGMTASQMLDLPFYHPTVEEGLKSALRDICKATASPVTWSRDNGQPSGA